LSRSRTLFDMVRTSFTEDDTMPVKNAIRRTDPSTSSDPVP